MEQVLAGKVDDLFVVGCRVSIFEFFQADDATLLFFSSHSVKIVLTDAERPRVALDKISCSRDSFHPFLILFARSTSIDSKGSTEDES